MLSNHSVLMLLTQASDAMFKAREKELQRNDITAQEATALFILRRIGDEATPAKVSRSMVQEQHSVWALLDRMEKRGLVNKTRNLPFKNLVRVTITDKGRGALVDSSSMKSVDDIFSALSNDERRQLSTYLRKLRDRALQELRVESPIPFP